MPHLPLPDSADARHSDERDDPHRLLHAFDAILDRLSFEHESVLRLRFFDEENEQVVAGVLEVEVEELPDLTEAALSELREALRVDEAVRASVDLQSMLARAGAAYRAERETHFAAARREHDEEAAEGLLEYLKGDQPWGVRRSSVSALGELSQPFEGVPEALRASLLEENEEEARVREAAAEALGELEDDSAATVEALRRASQSDANEWVREAAAKVLAKLGLGEESSLALASERIETEPTESSVIPHTESIESWLDEAGRRVWHAFLGTLDRYDPPEPRAVTSLTSESEVRQSASDEDGAGKGMREIDLRDSLEPEILEGQLPWIGPNLKIGKRASGDVATYYVMVDVNDAEENAAKYQLRLVLESNGGRRANIALNPRSPTNIVSGLPAEWGSITSSVFVEPTMLDNESN